MAQEHSLAMGREVMDRLPVLLADLLDEDDLRIVEEPPDRHIDARFTDSAGREWVVQAKPTVSPGHVVEAAQRQRDLAGGDGIPLLVVPFMTAGAAKVADEKGVNWIDLAGNARIRHEDLFVFVEGRPNPYRSPGRPSTPFAPKSARITRVMLSDPGRWWRQRDLATETGLDDGSVSRVVRRLVDLALVTRRDREYRPRDPRLLLAAWADEYRLDRHDVVMAHLTGGGVDAARRLEAALRGIGVEHAFTGLSAAWALDHFARFRMTSVYVSGDPRKAVDQLELRRAPQGGNIQLIGPNDAGVFIGSAVHDGLTCVAPVQAYLDLRHLPERAEEAAEHLRSRHLRWDG